MYKRTQKKLDDVVQIKETGAGRVIVHRNDKEQINVISSDGHHLCIGLKRAIIYIKLVEMLMCTGKCTQQVHNKYIMWKRKMGR